MANVTANSTYLMTNGKANSTFLNCNTIYDDIVFVSMKIRAVLVSIYVLLIIIVVLVNLLAIYVNIKTKQWKNQSMRLVLYMSCGDVFYALFGFTAQIIHIMIPQYLECQHRRIILLIPHLSVYFSWFLIMFIAADRFLHVLFLERYKTLVNPVRFNLLLAFYLTVSVIQAIVVTFAPVLFGKARGAQYSGPANSIFIITTLILYIFSIFKLRFHNRQSRRIASKTRNMAQLATLFLVILTITYVPIVFFTALVTQIRQALDAKRTVLVMHALLILSKCNSFFNSLSYLYVNKGARRQVHTLMKRHDKSSRQINVNDENETKSSTS